MNLDIRRPDIKSWDGNSEKNWLVLISMLSISISSSGRRSEHTDQNVELYPTSSAQKKNFYNGVTANSLYQLGKVVNLYFD